MHEMSHQAGVTEALRDFAVSKYAGLLSDVLSTARRQAFGQPLEALKQIRSGTLFNPETGLYHHGLPRTLGGIAGSLAIPLGLTALFAKMNPEGSRGEVIGDMVGRTTGSLLGSPLLGAAGQVGGGMLLSNVGRELGRQYDLHTRPRNSEVVPEE